MTSFRASEGCQPESNLAWDTVFDPTTGLGDWAVASASETANRGGLQAKAALATAVELALFTERRCPPDHPLAHLAGGDLRGWWGNSVDLRDDLGEAELGSLLWLLERAPLTDDTARWAQSFAQDALTPLATQGAVASFSVTVEWGRVPPRLNLLAQLYARDGTAVYNRKFDLIWRQIS